MNVPAMKERGTATTSAPIHPVQGCAAAMMDISLTLMASHVKTLMNAKPTMVAVNTCNASTTWDHLNVAAGMNSDGETMTTAVHKFSQHPMLESAPTIGPRRTQPM